MRERPLLLILLFLLMLAVPFAYASYNLTVIYTKVNDQQWYYYEMDKAYTYMTAQIINELDYNSSTTGAVCKIAFLNASGANAYKKGVMITFGASELNIYYVDGVSLTNDVSKITGPASYNANDTYVYLQGNEFTVEAAGTTLVEDFGIDVPFQYIAVYGVSYTATGGYVQVKVNQGVQGFTAEFNLWFPAIISLAMLGTAIGMIKKFT